MANVKHFFSTLSNPFLKIAGIQALLWGIAGIIISIGMSITAPIHYHGLLHFGPASNNAWWCFAGEHIIIWLIPSILFFVAGKLLSPSHIRGIDVFGTIAFAQLPFILMNLFFFPESVQKLMNIPTTATPEWIMQQPDIIKGAFITFPSILFMVIVLIWMYQAFKVSCNLKGWKLGLSYAVIIIASDIICRQLIKLMY